MRWVAVFVAVTLFRLIKSHVHCPTFGHSVYFSLFEPIQKQISLLLRQFNPTWRIALCVLSAFGISFVALRWLAHTIAPFDQVRKSAFMETMGHSNRNGELFFLQKSPLNDISQFNYVSSTRSSISSLSLSLTSVRAVHPFIILLFCLFWIFYLSPYWISLLRAHHSFFVDSCNLISQM